MATTSDASHWRFAVADKLTAVWVLLVFATLVSFWIGTDHGIASARWSGVVVVTIGFVKAAFVVRTFMETRFVPRALRLAFDLWLVLSALGVSSILLIA